MTCEDVDLVGPDDAVCCNVVSSTVLFSSTSSVSGITVTSVSSLITSVLMSGLNQGLYIVIILKLVEI